MFISDTFNFAREVDLLTGLLFLGTVAIALIPHFLTFIVEGLSELGRAHVRITATEFLMQGAIRNVDALIFRVFRA